MLAVSVGDAQGWLDPMFELDLKPKILKRGIASPSSIYKYPAVVAGEPRLRINAPNPAYAEVIVGEPADPRDETKAFGAAWARRLMRAPSGDSLIDCGDETILNLYLRGVGKYVYG